MSKKLIEVTNLKKYFPVTGGVLSRKVGDIKAVDGLSFHINEGETFGLVGESGCGKSTAGRTISHLHKATAGRVQFKDTVLFDVENKEALDKKSMRSLRRDIQMIFQDPFASLDPRMNIGAIVSEGLIKHKIMDKHAALARTKELLEICGLDGSNAAKYPHEFSGGQRQRIGIARSLALNPKFIICDEPTAALDVSIQAQVLTLMQKLKEEMGLTYLFISHDLSLVRYFCDRLGIMYLGSFMEIGTSEQLFKSALHPYSQALLSAVPRSHPSEKRERIILEGDVPSPANPPKGCKFHTRCPKALPVCSQKAPEMAEPEPGHRVWCHLVK
ncbi:MAG: ABC transporter ATP-binding protein [Spirochaetales bacterium]|nr:ABC transporter ATP-binding protein [Spirochaetales bacterium]